jgi:hypothetical protein
MARVTIDTNQLTAPAWAADFLSPDKLIPGGAKVVAASFNSGTPYTVTVADAAAAQGDVALGVAALGVAIPAGTVLDFGVHGSGWQMLAMLSADAAAGATSLTVEPLSGAISDTATATFYADADGRKPIASGTVLGRDWSERDGGAGFGPADTAGGDDEIFLVAFDVTDAAVNNDVELVKPGATIYENLLPEWSDLTSALKAQLRSTYVCLKGQV